MPLQRPMTIGTNMMNPCRTGGDNHPDEQTISTEYGDQYILLNSGRRKA